MGKMKSIVSCVIVAAALLWSRNASAAVYYIATTGSNSGAGTIGSPWQTISYGITKLVAGDTLYVRAGTYTETFTGAFPSGASVGVPITMSAYPGEVVTLAPSATVDNLFKITTAAYFIIDGFIMDGTHVVQAILFLGSGASNSAHDIIIRNSTIKNTAGDGVLSTNLSSGYSFINDQIFNNGGGQTRNHGMYLEGDNNLVDHCNIYNNAGYGINLYNGYAGAHANNNIVRYSQLHNNNVANGSGVGGLGVSSGSNDLVYNNLIWGNGLGIKVGESDGTTATTNTHIYNNTVYNNNVGGSGSRLGIYLDPNGSGSVVQNNIAYNDLDGDVVNAGQSGTTITNNLTANPSFAGAAANNFALLAGSPAIDAGVAVSAVPDDFIGTRRPQGAAYDIGAYEYTGGTTVQPPAITAVAATGIGPTSATIGWTTNVPADSQVVYGLTSAYGSATTLISALTTGHSAGLSGLTAGTGYHYAVKSHDSGGNLATSPDATFTTGSSVTPPGCVTSAASSWQNVSLAAQTGSFTAAFDATPAAANIDGISGVSNGAASAFTSLAAAVRFNNTGMIDARNGGAYAAASAIPYVAGMAYHFNLVVNVPAHTYSAYVTQGANAQQLIGANYAFRTEQSAATTLNNFSMTADIGSFTDCNVVAAAAAPTTVISAVSTAGIGPTAATIVWTTNNAADSQVQYGPTTAYGVTTTLNGTPVTSHSVALGGLTAGTGYHYHVMSRDAGGSLVTSPDATFTTTANTAPPVITGVSATAIGPTAATIVWTTDKPADSQVAYGLTTAYGSLTTQNTTLTTSHSAALSGLTASTVYHYAVGSHDATGNLGTSPDATFTTAGNVVPPSCVTSAASSWKNVPLTAQTGSFTASFDATPSAANMDGISGLSNGPASAFPSLAAAVRFNNTGKIDARNAGVYAAASAIPYTAGLSYHVQLVVNVPAHTYSSYVTQGSNAQQTIGLNYAFRTEQKAAALLSSLAAVSDVNGSLTVCNVVP